MSATRAVRAASLPSKPRRAARPPHPIQSERSVDVHHFLCATDVQRVYPPSRQARMPESRGWRAPAPPRSPGAAASSARGRTLQGLPPLGRRAAAVRWIKAPAERRRCRRTDSEERIPPVAARAGHRAGARVAGSQRPAQSPTQTVRERALDTRVTVRRGQTKE